MLLGVAGLPAVLRKPAIAGGSCFLLLREAYGLSVPRLHWRFGNPALPSTYLYHVALDALDESDEVYPFFIVYRFAHPLAKVTSKNWMLTNDEVADVYLLSRRLRIIGELRDLA